MTAARLTPNAVAATLAGDINLKPVVQVVDLRSITVTGPPGAGPRFRAIISDGVATTQALFAAQLCDLARSGLVRRRCDRAAPRLHRQRRPWQEGYGHS